MIGSPCIGLGAGENSGVCGIGKLMEEKIARRILNRVVRGGRFWEYIELGIGYAGLGVHCQAMHYLKLCFRRWRLVGRDVRLQIGYLERRPDILLLQTCEAIEAHHEAECAGSPEPTRSEGLVSAHPKIGECPVHQHHKKTDAISAGEIRDLQDGQEPVLGVAKLRPRHAKSAKS